MTAHCQQFELYAAEAGSSHGRELSVGELQAYVDELRESAYYRRNFPEIVRIEAYVRPESCAGGSVGSWRPDLSAGKIEMARCHLNELYVLHEVSHVLAAARYGSRSHDPWFARTYLELVSTELGSAAYAALREAFDEHAVDHDTDSAVPGGITLC